jgi:hypothetical protein
MHILYPTIPLRMTWLMSSVTFALIADDSG